MQEAVRQQEWGYLSHRELLERMISPEWSPTRIAFDERYATAV
jgi:hypothetical protein